MRRFTQLPPLALYVHIPWCERKCPYCDFNSHQQRVESLPEQVYVDALLADLELELPDIWGRQVVSIFIGGGTPSLFSADALEKLLSGIRARTAYAPNIEVTMEANPGSVEYARFAEYLSAGVNRLSIGIQSFDDASLQALGRIHSGAQARAAVATAHKAGFENINLDLMFGLPEQSSAAATADLSEAIALAPQHISYYQLTIEPNTYFAKYPPQLPQSDAIWQQQAIGMEQLEAHGYARYEISAFAQAHKQCQHNLNYWLFGDYVGIGAGAHGKLSFAHNGTLVRRWKLRHPQQYMDRAGSAAQVGAAQIVPEHESGIEFMMNALRLIDGFPLSLYPLNTGCDIYPLQDTIDKAIADNLLAQQDFHLRPTERGINFLNELLERFVPEEVIARYPIIPVLDKTVT